MPLTGVSVIELGSFIAGPFCGRILADFGAEVIKVESPEKGDPMRNWGAAKYRDKSLWWPIQSRNKKCITLNLRTEEGQEVIKKMVEKTDIVIENFRPGTLEKWGLGYEDLKKVNPSIIMVRISGFGQTGPYKDKAGFGVVGEAMGGLRHVTGYPDRAPTRVGIAIGDSVAAMYGVIGALMALRHRDDSLNKEGQYIDVALYEAVFSLMESGITEYMKVGKIRERTGSRLPGVAPSNIYPTKDGKWIIIAGNADNVWKRLATLMDKHELVEDERYKTHNARGKHQDELDDLITKWTTTLNLDELSSLLDLAGVPAGKIYSMEDIANDLQYKERKMIVTVEDEELGELQLPGIVPKLSQTPGTMKWTGPKLGEANKEIYQERLGISEEEYRQLKEKGVI